ncbi:MAG: ABC transporter ATP-binding protein [Agathobacter sp.]|nr:ABC transporter ATP-binding protein [Agathobacter sp.]
MKKKLSVKNLVISFRTPAGKVQAVRNISFDLHEGETLAVVGESGSGKSVTSKAILGILAGNSIIEGGSIVYDGMDLLKITEDEFYRIRGDKIAMIFQDPLSSLNPIMRIGNQLTEAMLLKGKARQKSCREAFNSTLALLSDEMVVATGDQSLKEMCTNFDKFEFKHIELEQAYNGAKESAVEVLDEIKDVLFYIEKDAFKDPDYTLKEIARLSSLTPNEYVVKEDADKLKGLLDELKKVSKAEIRNKKYPETARILAELQGIMERAIAKDIPDFFSMGYYLTFSGKELPAMPVKELNEYLKEYMNENYMNNFKGYVVKALEHSATEHMKLKEEALKVVLDNRHVFEGESIEKKSCLEAAEVMIKAVEASIDKLEIHKDGVAYTFGIGLKAAINSYFDGIPKNVQAAKLHAKQQKK